MRTHLLPAILLILVVATGAGVLVLRQNNARLQAHVDARRQEIPITHRSNSALPPQMGTVEQVKALVLSNEMADRLTQLREEIATLEQKAQAQAEADRDAIEALDKQRNPEQGMMKLEHMQNVGQATPAAALQTLFWAALKGEDQVMTRIIGWDETVRPKAQALIDRLPAEMRARYPTPEALAALFFSKHVLDVPAIHISKSVFTDAANASLTVKGLTRADQHLPMRLGPNGWQIIAGEPMLKGLSEQLSGKKSKR
jgi:hypothetical protein